LEKITIFLKKIKKSYFKNLNQSFDLNPIINQQQPKPLEYAQT